MDVILQRWEPVISESFPKQIPLWIELRGLPLHYWKPKMITDIGEELGELMDHEVTSTSDKMKVLINGPKPLTKETIIKFPNGSEAQVALEYKQLKKHCSHCHQLSHKEHQALGKKQTNEHQRSFSTPSKDKETPSAKPKTNFPQKSYQGTYNGSLNQFSYTPSAQNERAVGKSSYDERKYRGRSNLEWRVHENRVPSYNRSHTRSYQSIRNESSRNL